MLPVSDNSTKSRWLFDESLEISCRHGGSLEVGCCVLGDLVFSLDQAALAQATKNDWIPSLGLLEKRPFHFVMSILKAKFESRTIEVS